MKKLLLLIVVTYTLLGCKADVDYGYLIEYKYLNFSSSDITVEAHGMSLHEEMIMLESFTIPAGYSHTVKYSTMGGEAGVGANVIIRPFRTGIFWGPSKDYVVVSNGEKTVTQYAVDWRESQYNLYNLYGYLLIFDDGYHMTYEYEFTDAFFENAEPSEEE